MVPRYLLDDVELRFGHAQTAGEAAELEAPAGRTKESLARGLSAGKLGGASIAYDETNGIVYVHDIRPDQIGLASFALPQ